MKAHRLLGPFLALAGCAPPTSVNEPLRYPALPPGPSASSASAAFEPDPAASPVELACRAGEPALANALDDDCDGRIDGTERDAPLVVVLAYARTLSPTLALESDGGRTVDLGPPVCEEPSAFCTVRIDGARLARGQHTLSVRAEQPGETSGAVLIAVQTRGKVSTYLAPIARDGRAHALGRLSLP